MFIFRFSCYNKTMKQKIPKAKKIEPAFMNVGNQIKMTAWGVTLESIAVILLGIFFVIWPEITMRIATYLIGLVFIIQGCFTAVNYFARKGQNNFLDSSLLVGIAAILIGLTIFVIGEDIANIFRIIIGIWIIYEAFVRANLAIKLSSAGITQWKYVLALALVILAFGIFVVFNDVMTIIGWLMIGVGIIGLVSDLLFAKRIKILIEKLTK